MFDKLKQLFSKEKKKQAQPEDAYVTTITDELLTVEHPKRPVESIHWDEIEQIILVNTDEGPFLPDVWLILSGNNTGCSIPQGSDGFEKVFDIVSKYENFNFENFIESMSCIENKQFLLWQKQD